MDSKLAAMAVGTTAAAGGGGGSKQASSDNKKDKKKKKKKGSGITRRTMACERCRKHKVRCEGGNPCDRCGKVGAECTFNYNRKKRGPAKGAKKRAQNSKAEPNMGTTPTASAAYVSAAAAVAAAAAAASPAPASDRSSTTIASDAPRVSYGTQPFQSSVFNLSMGGAPLGYAGDQAYAVNGLALDLVGAGGGPLPPASMDLIGLDVTSDEALALVEDGLNEFLDEFEDNAREMELLRRNHKRTATARVEYLDGVDPGQDIYDLVADGFGDGRRSKRLKATPFAIYSPSERALSLELNRDYYTDVYLDYQNRMTAFFFDQPGMRLTFDETLTRSQFFRNCAALCVAARSCQHYDIANELLSQARASLVDVMDEFSLEVTAGLLLISQFYWGVENEKASYYAELARIAFGRAEDSALKRIYSNLPPLKAGAAPSYPVKERRLSTLSRTLRDNAHMDASQVVGPIPQQTIDHVGDGDAVNPFNSVMVLGPGPVPMTVSVSREMFEAQPRRVNEGTEIGLRLLGAGLGGEVGREIEGMADEIAVEMRLAAAAPGSGRKSGSDSGSGTTSDGGSMSPPLNTSTRAKDDGFDYAATRLEVITEINNVVPMMVAVQVLFQAGNPVLDYSARELFWIERHPVAPGTVLFLPEHRRVLVSHVERVEAMLETKACSRVFGSFCDFMRLMTLSMRATMAWATGELDVALTAATRLMDFLESMGPRVLYSRMVAVMTLSQLCAYLYDQRPAGLTERYMEYIAQFQQQWVFAQTLLEFLAKAAPAGPFAEMDFSVNALNLPPSLPLPDMFGSLPELVTPSMPTFEEASISGELRDPGAMMAYMEHLRSGALGNVLFGGFGASDDDLGVVAEEEIPMQTPGIGPAPSNDSTENNSAFRATDGGANAFHATTYPPSTDVPFRLTPIGETPPVDHANTTPMMTDQIGAFRATDGFMGGSLGTGGPPRFG